MYIYLYIGTLLHESFWNAEMTGVCTREHFYLPVQLPTGGDTKFKLLNIR